MFYYRKNLSVSIVYRQPESYHYGRSSTDIPHTSVCVKKVNTPSQRIYSTINNNFIKLLLSGVNNHIIVKHHSIRKNFIFMGHLIPKGGYKKEHWYKTESNGNKIRNQISTYQQFTNLHKIKPSRTTLSPVWEGLFKIS